MSRLKQIQDFIEFDLKNNFIIEPETRYPGIKDRVLDVINLYNPKVVMKAGIGQGNLLLDIAGKNDLYCVVVEPSFTAIKDFLQKNNGNDALEKIKFINGDLSSLPVNYNVIDSLICVDCLDFFDSSKCIDEFKRVLQFDGIFFLATVVLNDNDVDGLYDDFMKMIFPIHNDYYISGDLTTFLELKEFKIIKNIKLKFKKNLTSEIDYLTKIFDHNAGENALNFINEHKEDFKSFLNMNDNYEISEPYYIGLYLRLKPEK